MTAPLETTNPQDFKLRIYWIVGFKNKRMVAEFHDCKWLPRIGETLVLPIKEEGKSWHKFKVVDVVYDFQRQTVRVWCKPKHSITQKDTTFDFEQIEKRIEARIMKAKTNALELESQARLEHEFNRISEEVDRELEELEELEAENVLDYEPEFFRKDLDPT